MSDIETVTPRAAAQPVAHRCHCGAWAGFGFSEPGRHQPAKWWCWEHYPYRQTETRREAEEIAELLAS